MMKLDPEDDSDHPRSELVKKASEQLEALFRWRWEWERTSSDNSWAKQDARVSSVIGNPATFAHRLQFRSMAQATDVMLYNATLLWILGIVWKVHPQGAQTLIKDSAASARTQVECSGHHPLENASLLMPGEATTLRSAAVEICKTLEYYIQNIQQNHDSTLFSLLPVGMAWSALKDDPVTDFKSWISNALNSSSVTNGYVTGDNSCGFGSFYHVPSTRV
jgi:hypothetical protein